VVEKTTAAQAPAPPQKEKIEAQQETSSASTGSTIGGAETRGTADISAEKVTPVARRFAEAQGVDISKITPAEPGERVKKEDVERYLEQHQAEKAAEAPATPAASPEPRQGAVPAVPRVDQPVPPRPAAVSQELPLISFTGEDRREERIRMSRRRRTIAARLVEAQRTAAMLTTFNDVDMGAVMELRKKRRDSFQEKFGIKLGFMSFFVKAAIGALKAFPQINAELQGDELVLKHYYDIGMAIGSEEGLVVPVIRNADRMNFGEIEKTIEGFVQKVRGGSLTLEDLAGGTFTITNGGVFGSLLSTPILNPPQVGILGLHRIEERPVALNGQVVIRPMMYLALTYDHRVVDGREAVQFLVQLKELIKDPEALLLEG
jgi:2-oxoglutarate dehydrogenase E2 component (dihydrolipoamide succinyltransferase)